MNVKNIQDIPVKGQRVLVRVDFNVPVKDGVILDDTRLRANIPTIKNLQERGARIIILAHFGRPKGIDLALSLRFLQEPLSALLGTRVDFAPEGVGLPTRSLTQDMKDGDVLLIENIRFYGGEEKNDPDFSALLASMGDLYVNDAFSVSHRAHASVEGVTHLLPSYGGAYFMGEVEALTKTLANPRRPLAAIVAGSKISTKLSLLENLLEKVDYLILGGGIANTFLAAKGYNVQASLVEAEMIPTATRICALAAQKECQIILPLDAVVAASLDTPTPHTATLEELGEGEKIFDIGPKTIGAFCDVLKKCKTVVWNGPLGVFEVPPFDKGTCALARIVGDLTKDGTLFSLCGGGETVAAITLSGAASDFGYMSLAGGAFLEFLEGKALPGVSALGRSQPTM
jgi:phosphoglycerate kinase